MTTMSNEPLQRLAQQSPGTDRIDLSTFRGAGDTPTNVTGRETPIASFKVETPHDVRDGKAFRIAIPAHETFTEDGAANTETLTLSNSLIDPPSTAAAVAFEGGTVAAVDAFDTANDTVDVVTTGSANTIDVFYISDAPATFKLKKEAPNSEGTATRTLYETDLLLPHSADQYESAETIDTPDLQGLVPTDFSIVATIDADYSVDLGPISRTNGDAKATNAMLSIPMLQGSDSVQGLGSLVAQRMVM